MNKQELIEKYEKIINDNSIELYGCYNMVDKLLMQKIYKSVLDDLKQLDEPQKPVVPQFVADHLKKSKEVGRDLQDAMNSSTILEEVDLWLYTDNNMDVFARAWLDGYEVEKEKRYLVKMKGLDIDEAFLKFQLDDEYWYMGIVGEYKHARGRHTRKELENAGFGWVFDCEGMEVEEVEE